jgi:hypothetical protein
MFRDFYFVRVRSFVLYYRCVGHDVLACDRLVVLCVRGGGTVDSALILARASVH